MLVGEVLGAEETDVADSLRHVVAAHLHRDATAGIGGGAVGVASHGLRGREAQALAILQALHVVVDLFDLIAQRVVGLLFGGVQGTALGGSLGHDAVHLGEIGRALGLVGRDLLGNRSDGVHFRVLTI